MTMNAILRRLIEHEKKTTLWLSILFTSLFLVLTVPILLLANHESKVEALNEQMDEIEQNEVKIGEEQSQSQIGVNEGELTDEQQRELEDYFAEIKEEGIALAKAKQEQSEPTFDVIYNAYKQNELLANEEYQHNRYTITAKIDGMETNGLFNLTGGATLTMEVNVDNTIVIFYAEFEKEQEEALKKVTVGDIITFEGTCLSAGSWIDCKII